MLQIKITGESVKGGKYTGILSSGTWANGIKFQYLWYNHSIIKVRIKEVMLQFSDGIEETVPGSSIEYVQGRSGCYVATTVYGSYDCTQVWTLRRYRDYELAKTWYGRVFIHIYYAISSTLVNLFGDTEWFKRMLRRKLDHMVNDLQEKGYESTPYIDCGW